MSNWRTGQEGAVGTEKWESKGFLKEEESRYCYMIDLTPQCANSRGSVSVSRDVRGAGNKENWVRDKATRRKMIGNLLEAGASGRAVVFSLFPWVFLSGLQGSRHNSLNWFSLLHI